MYADVLSSSKNRKCIWVWLTDKKLFSCLMFFLKKLLHFNGEISDLTAKKFAISFKSSTKVLKIICYDCPLCMLALPWIFNVYDKTYEGQILDLKKSQVIQNFWNRMNVS